MSTIASSSTPPPNRHALTAIEKQRGQLEKLLKDPHKPAYIAPAPKEKTIRPPREMMKNVQGSSAGAGSGEFHVYKASRRREYERLKLLEDTTQKEIAEAEFERKRREAEEAAEAKTAKNRAKRQKKKDRAKAKGTGTQDDKEPSQGQDAHARVPIKKRRLVNGKEMIFRQPGEESDDSEANVPPDMSQEPVEDTIIAGSEAVPVAELPRVTFIEE
ncbi:PRKR-interacting protein 1 like protein [Termitomyces sp. T112]|nr:PRKR-interacting protein 1 like protein [Termitomyces sp. T112]KAH0589071.1 hypothetical protein H2248_004842 [Termitomyces sp. 'cryptogamus']KNZ72798.1 PRKR-interacting protein 1 like protein [Termitomyces sp. J132]